MTRRNAWTLVGPQAPPRGSTAFICVPLVVVSPLVEGRGREEQRLRWSDVAHCSAVRNTGRVKSLTMALTSHLFTMKLSALMGAVATTEDIRCDIAEVMLWRNVGEKGVVV
ncbi:unnamed protein product, partial [Hydatigera taeniaeformis]|uniref:Uncharacterized protein n=1 Tax=Hydatigena taeniaeformis TaxID=6205 RepID=A0A0R3XBS4_HYDTA